jgi:hypothetical protein
MSASEISMGNPTIGTLEVSDGLRLKHCNPAILWSSDSRYLAVPQYRLIAGLQLRQRLVVVDHVEKRVHGSKALGWYIQPIEFGPDALIVEINPHARCVRRSFVIPSDLRFFRSLPAEWSQ